MLSRVASGLFEANREMLLELIKRYGVKVLAQARVKEVGPEKIFIDAADGERSFTADLIVLAVSRKAANNSAEIAGELVEEVYVIGGYASSRKIKDATWEVFKRARIV